MLHDLTKGKHNSLPCGIPNIWRELKGHTIDCYFYLINTKKLPRKRHKITCTKIPSVIRPTEHSNGPPVSVLTELSSSEDTIDEIQKTDDVSKVGDHSQGNPKAPFSIVTTPMCRGGRYSFPGLLYFTLDPYLIMLSVKQGGIKYHFFSLWYYSTWDWTQVSRAIGEHSNP